MGNAIRNGFAAWDGVSVCGESIAREAGRGKGGERGMKGQPGWGAGGRSGEAAVGTEAKCFSAHFFGCSIAMQRSGR